jgi:hypothetical protein
MSEHDRCEGWFDDAEVTTAEIMTALWLCLDFYRL